MRRIHILAHPQARGRPTVTRAGAAHSASLATIGEDSAALEALLDAERRRHGQLAAAGQPRLDHRVVVVAGEHHHLAPREAGAEVFEEAARARERVAARAMAQLEHVAEQHKPIGILQRPQQGARSSGRRSRSTPGRSRGAGQRRSACAWDGPTQRSRRPRGAPWLARARLAPGALACDDLADRLGQHEADILAHDVELGDVLVAHARARGRGRAGPPPARRGREAPEETPTTRLPVKPLLAHLAALSIRCASVPQSRATSTRRTELEELREPITSTRSQLTAICLTAVWRLVVA